MNGTNGAGGGAGARGGDNPFVHLHVHSEYSLLDGAARVKDLPRRAAELGMPSVALTEHGVMYGMVDFYKACREHDVKPIIGCEIYLAPRSRHQREPRVDDRHFHLLLLAENMTGYHNLLKIVSRAYTEGFYHRPRADVDLLSSHSDGLIATSACLSGPVTRSFVQGNPEEARRWAATLRDIFGKDNFFMEIQDHGMELEKRAYGEVARLAKEMGMPLVATNDVHYLNKSDARAQEVLMCIQSGKTLDDPTRLRFDSEEFYFKSGAEMWDLFGHVPEALHNTLVIAERCDVQFNFGEIMWPEFQVPEGHTHASYLRHLCRERIPARYGRSTPEVEERLEYELNMIETLGFAPYFLIVWDFVEFARRTGIPVGPGRGSGAASIVAYLLGITNVEPLRYKLVFERFINPERVSPPDFDIDFCYERRGEVIDYVVEKYGDDRVAQIITFGTMAARAAIRDVGRVLGMSYGEVDRIAKMVPEQLGITIDEAVKQSPELSAAKEEDARVGELIDLARRMEGLPRHASVHAAGVVITPGPAEEYLPLQRMSDGTVVTQLEWTRVEEIGLLKFDFLGLRTLTVMEEARRIINEERAEKGLEPIDFDSIPLDDGPTYELLGRGDTSGVFQLESPGMRDMLREMRPSSIEDIIAAVALYRPGPMQHIPDFVRNKHGGKVDYLHPDLEPLLADTYGVIVYQEQIMQIAANMAGFTLGQADILRRGIGKKDRGILDTMKDDFVEGVVSQGYEASLGEALYDLIERFADYGFQRAHSTSYGMLAYQTAWLKANYPVPLMAATLTSFMSNNDKVAEYIAECRRMGIQVLPPDVNESQGNFVVVGGNSEEEMIRFGLSAVKNVGRGCIEAIIAAREESGPFTSLTDFCQRTDYKHMNRRALESLIKAGAFDSLQGHRRQYLSLAEAALQSGARWQKQRADGQTSLFDMVMGGGGDGGPAERGGTGSVSGGAPGAGAGGPGGADSLFTAADVLPDVPPLTESERLTMEKEVLGLYLSGHPLDEILHDALAASSHSMDDLADAPDKRQVTLAGLVAAVKRQPTRRGDTMAFLTLEDRDGKQVEIVVFPSVFAEAGSMLQADTALIVDGRIDRQEDAVKVLASRIRPLEEGPKLYLTMEEGSDHSLRDVRFSLEAHRGPVPVFLVFPHQRRVALTHRDYWVNWNAMLVTDLEAALGKGAVTFVGAGSEGGQPR